MRIHLLFLVLLVSVSPSVFADDRLPEPTPAQQDEASKLVRDVFKDDFAKRGIEERKELGQKLLEEGRNNKSDAASEYVLLRESRDAASQVGDVETATAAIDEMGKAFVIDAVTMKAAALAAMRTSLHTVDAQQAGAEASIALVNEAMIAENFDAAAKAADLAVMFATGAKNMAMAAEAQSRKTDIKAQATAYLALKVGEEKLKKDPKDGPANFAVGSYAALYQNNWDKGLPLIAIGDDTAFAAAAKADVASPVDVAQMIKVGDQWWDLASLHPAMKTRLLTRAEFWYNLVSGNADGLIKAKVDKRLEQIAAAKEGTGMGLSVISEATRKALPTVAEMKQLKDLVLDSRTNGLKQNEYFQFMQTLQSRLSVGLMSGKEGDFFARCKADLEIRKVTANGPNFYNNNAGLLTNFQTYAEQAKSKDEFVARLLAYEKFNNTEKAIDPVNLDSIVYSTVRNYVIRNQQLFPAQLARKDFCIYLRTKGVKSTGVDRYRTFVERSRLP